MKKVISLDPFMGLIYEDEDGTRHRGKELDLTTSNRLDSYFGMFQGRPFRGNKAEQLGQLALDNEPIPADFNPEIA